MGRIKEIVLEYEDIIEGLEDRIEELTDKIADLEDDKEFFQEQITDLEFALDDKHQVEKELERLENVFDKVKKERDDLESELEGKDLLEKELINLQKAFRKVQKERNEYKDLAEGYKADIEECYKPALLNKSELIKDLNQKYDELSDELEEREATVERLRGYLND